MTPSAHTIRMDSRDNVANGRKQAWAERWRPKKALVLFNPAPVT